MDGPPSLSDGRATARHRRRYGLCTRHRLCSDTGRLSRARARRTIARARVNTIVTGFNAPVAMLPHRHLQIHIVCNRIIRSDGSGDRMDMVKCGIAQSGKFTVKSIKLIY